MQALPHLAAIVADLSMQMACLKPCGESISHLPSQEVSKICLPGQIGADHHFLRLSLAGWALISWRRTGHFLMPSLVLRQARNGELKNCLALALIFPTCEPMFFACNNASDFRMGVNCSQPF